MPDTHPIESDVQVTINPDGLTPSSTSSSSDSSLSPPEPRYRRFLSFENIETSSAKILTRIRSRSPLPRSSSQAANEKHRHSPPPTAVPTAAEASQSPTFPLESMDSPSDYSPTSPQHAPRPGFSHHSRSASAVEQSKRSRSDNYKRYSGTVNHCGRHSNEWLFGGFSVRDSVRHGIDKMKGQSEKDS